MILRRNSRPEIAVKISDTSPSPHPPHEQLFAIEYGCSGMATKDYLGDIATGLGMRLLRTVRNQLVQDGRGQHFSDSPYEDELDYERNIPFVTCTVIGNANLPPVDNSWFDVENIERYGAQRPRPRQFAARCVTAVRMALWEAGFYVELAPSRGSFDSGPEMMPERPLFNEIATLPVLTAPVPDSAEAFAREIAETGNIILGRVSGGALPAVVCDIEYGRLPTW